MKGLFYKEARCLWHFGKTYLLMLVIFLGLALYQSTDSSGGAVWMLYPIFFAGALPASLIGDDEKSGWLTYCDTLPVTRRQIVTVKYITCLVTAAICTPSCWWPGSLFWRQSACWRCRWCCCGTIPWRPCRFWR